MQDPREGIAWFGNTDHRATVQAFDTWPNEKAPGARCPGCFLGCVPFGEGDLRLCRQLERVAGEDFASAITLDRGAQLLSDFQSRHGSECSISPMELGINQLEVLRLISSGAMHRAPTWEQEMLKHTGRDAIHRLRGRPPFVTGFAK